jgi:hypothetical protein
VAPVRTQRKGALRRRLVVRKQFSVALDVCKRPVSSETLRDCCARDTSGRNEFPSWPSFVDPCRSG